MEVTAGSSALELGGGAGGAPELSGVSVVRIPVGCSERSPTFRSRGDEGVNPSLWSWVGRACPSPPKSQSCSPPRAGDGQHSLCDASLSSLSLLCLEPALLRDGGMGVWEQQPGGFSRGRNLHGVGSGCDSEQGPERMFLGGARGFSGVCWRARAAFLLHSTRDHPPISHWC